MNQLAEPSLDTTTMGLNRAPAEPAETTSSVASVQQYGEAPSTDETMERVIISSHRAQRPMASPVSFDEAEAHTQAFGRIMGSFDPLEAASVGSVDLPGALKRTVKVFFDHSVEEVEDAELASALRDSPDTPPPETTERARAVMSCLRRLGMKPDRIAVTRSCSVAVTFMRGRRYGIFECDSEGDVVLTLTDRTLDEEADTYIVERGAEGELLKKTAEFLEG